MSDYIYIPSATLKRAERMEDILIKRATGGSDDNHIYQALRQDFMADFTIRDLLPKFVQIYRNLDAFWTFI